MLWSLDGRSAQRTEEATMASYYELGTIEGGVGSDAGGTFVEWYFENDDGESFVARWYGPLAECAARVNTPPPPREFEPVTDCSAPPYDAATATGMYDWEG
jgi:hypothetical protein